MVHAGSLVNNPRFVAESVKTVNNINKPTTVTRYTIGTPRVCSAQYKGNNEAKRPKMTKLYGVVQLSVGTRLYGVGTAVGVLVGVPRVYGVVCRWSVGVPRVVRSRLLRATPPGGQ